ncbi:MAG: sugar phosphate isomerase/epimerase [Betaproteobacteria bacterium]|nr:MAG: sugar phosphate isomerase/epimerase [Betaproteobacteria bacterium]
MEGCVNLSRFGMNTVTLAGDLEAKLDAISNAGFQAIELWAKDLTAHAGGVAAASRAVRNSGLRISSFQLLRDFEGLPDAMLQYKLDTVKPIMEMMRAVGCDLLLVSSSTSPDSSGEKVKLADDLAKLATLATPLDIRVGYEPLSWGRWINDYPSASEIVELADRKNLGLVLDSFQFLARATSLEQLDAISGDRIFLFQLSDFGSELTDPMETARHRRVFPGEGSHGAAIVELIERAAAAGYGGDYTFEVFNDDYLRSPAPVVMERARKSVEWLGARTSLAASGANRQSEPAR